MPIYSENGLANLYCPTINFIPLSTEIKISHVGSDKDWFWAQLKVNSVTFFKSQVHRKDKEKLISKLQVTADKIISVMMNNCEIDGKPVGSIMIDDRGEYAIKYLVL